MVADSNAPTGDAMPAQLVKRGSLTCRTYRDHRLSPVQRSPTGIMLCAAWAAVRRGSWSVDRIMERT